MRSVSYLGSKKTDPDTDQFLFLDNQVRIQEIEYESLLENKNDSSSIAVTTIELGYDKSCSI